MIRRRLVIARLGHKITKSFWSARHRFTERQWLREPRLNILHTLLLKCTFKTHLRTIKLTTGVADVSGGAVRENTMSTLRTLTRNRCETGRIKIAQDVIHDNAQSPSSYFVHIHSWLLRARRYTQRKQHHWKSWGPEYSCPNAIIWTFIWTVRSSWKLLYLQFRCHRVDQL